MYVRFDPYNPHPKHYKRFWRYWHEPPYICEYCGEEITGEGYRDLVVHHVDHDHANVSMENLMGLHRKCHPSVHIKGMERSAESRQRMSEAQTTRFANEDPEVRAARVAKSSAATLGTTHEKHKGFGELQRIAQLTSRMRECECGMRTNAGSMARHIEKTGHTIVSKGENE